MELQNTNIEKYSNHEYNISKEPDKYTKTHETIETSQELTLPVNKWLSTNLTDLSYSLGTKIVEGVMSILYDKSFDSHNFERKM